MKTQVIIPAAGMGERLGEDSPKPLLKINGKPILIYSLEVFDQCPLIESVIVVAHQDYVGDFRSVIEEHKICKVINVVAGGQLRTDSVFNGLKALDEDTEYVLIHDGARPLIDLETVEKAVNLCANESGVIVAVPVKPTIKRVNTQELYVEATLDRDLLWEVQTPQVFKKNILLKAHEDNNGIAVTDDATLVEMLGERIKVVEGQYDNIKITTKEDVVTAQNLLCNR